MIIVRFKVKTRPEKTDELRRAFEAVVAPSRGVDGVTSFDIGQDVTDPATFIATEVFEDAAARERQESLPEVGQVMSLLPDCLAEPPEATVYEIASANAAL